MKKYPKIVQADKRGQIVIPKEVREALNIDEGVGFWVFSIGDEGILLKKIDKPQLDNNDSSIKELKVKADKIELSKEKIEKAIQEYKKEEDFEEI